MAYVIFSKRQQRIQGEIPDTSPSETIPSELRFQILYIWEKVWEEADYNNYFGQFGLSDLATDAYKSIESTLREEYGVRALDEGSDPDDENYSVYEVVRDFLLKTENTYKVIDVIEVSFRYIDQEVRAKFYVPNNDEIDEIDKAFGISTSRRDISYNGIPPDEAIDLLNERFLEHSLWYKYESGQIVRVDSPDSHSEMVKPAEELSNNTQQAVNNSPMNNENKKIFIGHGGSPVWREFKDFLVETLELEYEEFDRVSPAGEFISNRLEEMLDKSCMAFLIMTGEDEQADGSVHARQNVVHEIAKCQERFGFKRAIILLEKGCEKFSNMGDLIYIEFTKKNIKETFGEIVRVLIREFIIRIERCN